MPDTLAIWFAFAAVCAVLFILVLVVGSAAAWTLIEKSRKTAERAGRSRE